MHRFSIAGRSVTDRWGGEDAGEACGCGAAVEELVVAEQTGGSRRMAMRFTPPLRSCYRRMVACRVMRPLHEVRREILSFEQFPVSFTV